MVSQNRAGYHKRLVAFPKALDQKLQDVASEMGGFQVVEIVRMALVEYFDRYDARKNYARIAELERQLEYFRNATKKPDATKESVS